MAGGNVAKTLTFWESAGSTAATTGKYVWVAQTLEGLGAAGGAYIALGVRDNDVEKFDTTIDRR
jgi:hypothetical protein